MKDKLLMFLASFFFCAEVAMAQGNVVTGVVTSADGNEPVVGASVMIKGTRMGVVTDVNGKFRLTGVPGSAKTLVVSSIGMTTKELAISHKGQMKIVLATDEKVLDEVVVTALGISRSEKTLGYSATTVKNDEITGARTTNVADALSGKVAGVQVMSTSSDPGSVSNVVIRGFSSIMGDNQPLYVVDGVPLQSSMVSAKDMGKNVSTGGISNIASEDIASMTVLKGAAATALYGSRAANGVILITTKNGAKADGRNFNISYSGSVQARRVSTLPDFQNDFGQGWNGKQTFIENGSWGPAFDGSMQVYGFVYDNSQLLHKYEAVKDNVKDFFDTGWMQNHNISLSGASDDNKMTYYLSYSYTGDDGIMPSDNDKFTRNTIAFRSTYQATDWLKVSASVNKADSHTDAVGSFQGTSAIDGIFELPRDVSLVDHKDLNSPFNTPQAWYTSYGITNPYWAIANNYNHTNASQINGKIQADITPVKNLTLTYRYGFDNSNYDAKISVPQINVDDEKINNDYGYAPSNMNQSGYVYTRYGRQHEYNHDFLANYQNKFLSDRLDLGVTAGVNLNERAHTRMVGQTDDLTFYTGFTSLNNGANKTTLEERQWKRRLVGVFGDVTLGWDEMLFLELTARNDWSSTLPINANNFFYPGATLSWIFTKLIPENDVLSFGKLRLAYGKTGNDADFYQTGVYYNQTSISGVYGTGIAQFPINGINGFSQSNTKGSSSLKPEMTKEFEVGMNLQFFKGRIGIDGTFYNRVTSDQIFTVPTDPATGFSYQVMNFGKVRNRGIELAVNTTPIQTKDFRWDLGFNFAKNWNKVLSLPESLEGGKVEMYRFSTSQDALYMYAVQGKPVGEFYANMPSRTKDGKIIVDENGLPVVNTTTVTDTGKNMNADWTGGVTTSLSYKGFSLSAALDIRKGGYMFSRTKNLMQFTGNGVMTTYNDRRPFVIPNSVVASYDDEGNFLGYVENTMPIYLTNSSNGIQDYFDKTGAGEGSASYLVDRSFVKLRNISLTWNLPKQWVRSISLSDVAITLFCNNVFTWTASGNRYIDPETTTVSQSDWGDAATQFGELYSNPACRTFGANLSVKF